MFEELSSLGIDAFAIKPEMVLHDELYQSLIYLCDISIENGEEEVPCDYTGWVKAFGENIVHYKNGVIHREDGPAIINRCGIRQWLSNGSRHRLDGPAVYHMTLSKTHVKSYFIEGFSYSEEKFSKHPEVLKFKIEKKLKFICDQ